MAAGELEPLIGVMTALPKEYAAVYAMLDKPVEVSKGGRGQRKYTEGSIPSSGGGVHRVVLALLPDMGNNSAAHRATLLLEHFPTVRTLLMVGIAGGAPNPAKPEDHVRLGDIVVSGSHGIIQYDYVAETVSETVHRHPPRPPGAALLEAVRILEAHELAGRRPWLAHWQRAAGIRGGERPAAAMDVLRAAPPDEGTVAHPHDPARRPGEPRVFVGVIGSADKLLRSALLRDRMRDRFKIRAFEMESSGIADATWGLDAGYLAIRGVCDYCDAAKDDTWQNHAAVVAAAYMRALLESLPAVPGPELAAEPSRGRGSTGRRRTPSEAAAVVASASTARATIDRASGTDLIAPLVLLQLSDLHFGPHSRFAGTDLERLAAQCRQALDEARSDLGWAEAVGLVVVTGDIAEAAYPPEYATAAKFFIALARQLALSPHRFVFVPGNHDISWTKCLGAEGQLKDEYGGTAIPPGELRARLDEVKLAHFEKFIRDVHGGKARHEVDGAAVTALAHGAFMHDFPDLGISIAALDSCERESHRQEDHVGALGAAQAQAVLDHWRSAPAERIRLAAVHHNPSAMASPAIDQWLGFLRSRAAELPVELVERIATNFVGFEGHEYLRSLASDAHASLILHGHHHVSATDQSWPWRGRDPGGAGTAHIVSAGSWGLSPESGKLPKDQPVVMQLIRLDPAAAQMHAVLLTYDPGARLPGEVRPGRFLLDAQTRHDRPLGLSLPPALRGRFGSTTTEEPVAQVREASARPRGPDLPAAMAAYRARKTGSFERWELRTAGPQPTAGNRPAEVTLDDMYIPLRFDANLDPSELDRGAPITADDLLQPRRPRVVIGSAGSGKTTWMRWTFRRLIREPRAVPFFLELRVIAAAWKTPQDAGQPVDRYLADELTACGVSEAAAVVAELLADSAGPRPVLLIDGWDELGTQGERLRERLVELCRAFPRVVVVVSSRPYGETRPAGAEGFDTLYIQPLSDDDVRLLATHFHRRVHGLDEAAGTRATGELVAALDAAPDARALASTALLLTMMLLLSREGPLPDRRHKLYTACLRNMLLHRVDQRERDGVVVARDQWRPPDSEERLRVIAELAYRMQTEGYQGLHRAPIIRAWEAAVELLRPAWPRDQRDQFLRWLVASAGVLVDRTDGSVHFAHLSFQEHLAAYYLFISREGDERVAAVRDHLNDRPWWETLRLWAGLTGDQWPDKLSPVLAMLREHDSGYWLAGMIFADGTGQASDFEAWAAELATRLSEPFSAGDDCAEAWGACKQSERRAVLATTLESVREGLSWLEGSWQADWCRLANLELAPAPALMALEAPIESARAVACSRVLVGGASSWPDASELALLRLWPSARGQVGIRLQAAISMGAQAPETMAMLPVFLTQGTRTWSREDHAMAADLGREFVQYFGREFVRYFGREFVRYFGRDLGRYFGRYFGREFVRYFIRHFIRDLGRYFGREFVRDFGRNFVRYFVRYFGQEFVRDLGRDFGRDLGREFVRDLGLAESLADEPWWLRFSFLEFGSVLGRSAPRATLAHGQIPDEVPLLALFRAACRASLAPGDMSLRAAIAGACDAFDGDPLWPALARHVARISTAEDRALLEDLARHPEKREPPLSWGLQHYVRGDLAFDDDSVVTLDELCARAGLAPPPFLEDMPDELDIPVEDDPD